MGKIQRSASEKSPSHPFNRFPKSPSGTQSTYSAKHAKCQTDLQPGPSFNLVVFPYPRGKTWHNRRGSQRVSTHSKSEPVDINPQHESTIVTFKFDSCNPIRMYNMPRMNSIYWWRRRQGCLQAGNYVAQPPLQLRNSTKSTTNLFQKAVGGRVKESINFSVAYNARACKMATIKTIIQYNEISYFDTQSYNKCLTSQITTVTGFILQYQVCARCAYWI